MGGAVGALHGRFFVGAVTGLFAAFATDAFILCGLDVGFALAAGTLAGVLVGAVRRHIWWMRHDGPSRGDRRVGNVVVYRLLRRLAGLLSSPVSISFFPFQPPVADYFSNRLENSDAPPADPCKNRLDDKPQRLGENLKQEVHPTGPRRKPARRRYHPGFAA